MRNKSTEDDENEGHAAAAAAVKNIFSSAGGR